LVLTEEFEGYVFFGNDFTFDKDAPNVSSQILSVQENQGDAESEQKTSEVEQK